MNHDITREELVAICEDAIVPMGRWWNRDSASAHEEVGRAWALLRAGAPFTVRTELTHPGSSCISDDRTIWIDITWKGFAAFDHNGGDETDTFYLPTRKRLEEAGDGDWY